MSDIKDISVGTTRHQAEANVFEAMRPRTFDGVTTSEDDWAQVVELTNVMGAGSIGAYIENTGSNPIDVRVAFRGRNHNKVTDYVPAVGDEVSYTLAAGGKGYIWSLIKLPDVAIQVKSNGAGSPGRLVVVGGIA